MFLASEEGYFISDNHRRVAEIVNDFDRNLEVQWIPPDKRDSLSEKEKPFRIIHRGHGDGQPYTVMELSDDEMNGKVIERLFQSRVDKNDIPAQVRAAQDAAKVLQLKRLQEEQEATRDFDVFRLKTPLHTFRHDGKVYRT